MTTGISVFLGRLSSLWTTVPLDLLLNHYCSEVMWFLSLKPHLKGQRRRHIEWIQGQSCIGLQTAVSLDTLCTPAH